MLLLLLAPTLTHSQQPLEPAPSVSADSSEAIEQTKVSDSTTDMVLLINAPPEKNEAQLRSLFIDAINYEGSGLTADLDRIKAVQIGKREFDDIKEMILGVTGSANSLVTDGVVSEDLERSQFWKVSLAGQEHQGKPARPSGIRVYYDNDALSGEDLEVSEFKEDFVLGSLQDEDAAFKFYNRTTAYLQLDPQWEPTHYQFLFQGTESELAPGKKISWPKTSKHFFAHIPRFSGATADRERFFKILRSGDIGEVLVNDSSRRSVRLIHMDTVGDGGLNEGTILSRSFAIRVEPLTKAPYDFVNNEGIERVWVLMPLTLEQRDAIVAQFEAMEDARVEVIEAIRSGTILNPSYSTYRISDFGKSVPYLPNLPEDWEQPTVFINEITEPMWFEVGLSGGDLDKPEQFRPLQYRRTFHLPVDTTPQLSFYDKYQVIVYESKAPSKTGGEFSYRSTLITDGNRNLWWRQTRTPRWRPPSSDEESN